jgi:hypothetical protein
MQIALCYVQVVLQGVVERLIEIGRCCGMEINVEETKVMKMQRQPSLAHIMIDKYSRRVWNIANIWVA